MFQWAHEHGKTCKIEGIGTIRIGQGMSDKTDRQYDDPNTFPFLFDNVSKDNNKKDKKKRRKRPKTKNILA